VAGVGTWCFSLLLLRTLNFSPFFSGQASHRGATDMRTISRLLFTDYLWPFEVLSLFLLVMIVAIFVLARPVEGDSQ
jgi:NADH:ubiquinone oxidoreductase subunit 6 (subunit J)